MVSRQVMKGKILSPAKRASFRFSLYDSLRSPTGSSLQLSQAIMESDALHGILRRVHGCPTSAGQTRKAGGVSSAGLICRGGGGGDVCPRLRRRSLSCDARYRHLNRRHKHHGACGFLNHGAKFAVGDVDGRQLKLRRRIPHSVFVAAVARMIGVNTN